MHPDGSGGRPFQANHRPEQRALSRSRSSENDDRFFWLHLKTDAVKDFALPILHTKIFGGNDGAGNIRAIRAGISR